MAKLTKKQHYVPVWYLKNFTNEKGFVHVWDKSKGEKFEAPPIAICREDYLYETAWKGSPDNTKFVLSNQIENTFSEEERKHSALVKRILNILLDKRNRGAVVCRSQEERKTMSSLVANLYLRNPVIINEEEVRVIPDDVMNHSVVKSMKALLDEFGMEGIESVVEHASLSAWVNPHMENSTHQQLVGDLMKSNYLFLVSEREEFLTSNFPCVIMKAEDAEGIRFYLPLSPKCAVVYDDSRTLKNKRNRIVQIDDDDVRTFNETLLFKNNDTVRFVISNKDIRTFTGG